MIKMSVKSRMSFPRFNFQKDLKYVADKIVIPELAGHIQQGEDIRGHGYAPLSPRTIKKKGHSMPLIGEERQLHKSFFSKAKGKSLVIVTLKANRKLIGRYLQIEGIKTKRGKRYFNFFGVSTTMEKKAISYIRNRIKETTRGFA